MKYTVEFTPESKKDFKKLDGSQKILVRKSITKVESKGMEVGKKLRGDLAGCVSLKHRKAGLRIIFRESEQGFDIIDIIAIGLRSDSAVYKLAENRLK